VSGAELIAIAAVAVAVAALVVAWLAFSKLSAVRRAQEVLLGGDAKKDVVEFAVSLQGRSTTSTARSTRSPPRWPGSSAASTPRSDGPR